MSSYNEKLLAIRDLSLLIEQYPNAFSSDHRLGLIKEIALSWADELAAQNDKREDCLILAQVKEILASTCDVPAPEKDSKI
jgi:hypothetical protein